MTDSLDGQLRDTRSEPTPNLRISGAARPTVRPYTNGKRLFYGLLWSGWTLLLAIAGFSLLPHGATIFAGLLAFALAIITGRYAFRIWTWQARRLIFFIIW